MTCSRPKCLLESHSQMLAVLKILRPGVAEALAEARSTYGHCSATRALMIDLHEVDEAIRMAEEARAGQEGGMSDWPESTRYAVAGAIARVNDCPIPDDYLQEADAALDALSWEAEEIGDREIRSIPGPALIFWRKD